MKKIAIIYGTSTDNTRDAAEIIASVLKDFSPSLFDVANVSPDDFMNYDHLFLGTSTWGLGDLQDDWDSILPKLKSINLSGKTVSLFGLGDSDSYPDTFVDGIGILHEFFATTGCKIIGSVATTGYSYDASRAEIDGKFVGLPLNADSESHLTKDRIEEWIKNIKEVW